MSVLKKKAGGWVMVGVAVIASPGWAALHAVGVLIDGGTVEETLDAGVEAVVDSTRMMREFGEEHSDDVLLVTRAVHSVLGIPSSS